MSPAIDRIIGVALCTLYGFATLAIFVWTGMPNPVAGMLWLMVVLAGWRLIALEEPSHGSFK